MFVVVSCLYWIIEWLIRVAWRLVVMKDTRACAISDELNARGSQPDEPDMRLVQFQLGNNSEKRGL